MVGDLCQSQWEEVQTPCQGRVGSSRQGQIKLGLPPWQFWPRGLGERSRQDLIRALGAVRVPPISILSQPVYLSKALQIL